MKKCSVCHKKKSYDNYAKNKSQKDGYQKSCRQCLSDLTSRPRNPFPLGKG